MKLVLPKPLGTDCTLQLCLQTLLTREIHRVRSVLWPDCLRLVSFLCCGTLLEEVDEMRAMTVTTLLEAGQGFSTPAP